MSIRLALSAAAIAVFLTGCDPQTTLTTRLPAVGSGTSYSALQPEPPNITITGLNTEGDVDIEGSAAAGIHPYTTSGCNGIVTIHFSGLNPLMQLTSVAVGTCTIHVTDIYNQSADVGVTVNSLTVPVN